MLIAFALTVIATRWFLAWTGYPKVGGGDVHIAHALWGGALLFVASLLPQILVGRMVHQLAAGFTGVGMGLFIDEVGKFITTRNDYFYPAAAPIIYATFLLSVLLFLRLRSARPLDRRRELASLIAAATEAAGAHVSFRGRGRVLDAPRDAAAGDDSAELEPLYATFELTAASAGTAEPTPGVLGRLARWWERRDDFWLGGRGIRAMTVIALILAGFGSFAALVLFGLVVLYAIPQSDLTMLAPVLTHVVVDGISGVLMFVGAVALATGRIERGAALASSGLLMAITLGDLLSFYLRQFDSISVVLFHLGLLFAVHSLRHRGSVRAPAPVPT